MNGAMFNSLARFIDRRYPQFSFTDLCRKAGLKTNVFAELTWYPDKDFNKLMQTIGQLIENEPATLWREFGRESFGYFIDIFGDYTGDVTNVGEIITAVNRIHHDIKRDGLGTPPILEFKRASPDNFEIRYASERKLDDFFLGMLEGAVKHFGSEVKILGRKERGRLTVTITVKEQELAPV
jgi:hypothetical protein